MNKFKLKTWVAMWNQLTFNLCLAIIFLALRNSPSTTAVILKRPQFSVGFLFQRTVSINQRSCICTNTSSCSCCQSVTILLQGVVRNLCVNFDYQQTGLSMSISLGSNVIRQVSIIDYKAFKVCTVIPNCPYSSACVEVLELSLFPRSITICIQLDVTSKIEHWLINYNCISISTVLPNQSNTSATTVVAPTTTNIVLNGTTGMNAMPPMGMPGTGQMNMTTMNGQMPNGQPGQMPSGQPGQMPSGQPGQMPSGQPGQMPSGQPGQMPSGQSGQMPSGQPGQMPSGQPGQMPSGQMPPGQMPMGPMPSGQMPSGQPGQMPMGPMPSGQMPMGQPGQMPPGQTQGMLIRKSETFRYGMRMKRLLVKNPPQDKRFSTGRDNGHQRRGSNKKKLISHDMCLGLADHRSKRNAHHEKTTAAMKMQVINRGRKNGLPRIKIGAPRRSSRIVNGDTISIPMSQVEIKNPVIPATTPTNNGVYYELESLQPATAFPSYEVSPGNGFTLMDKPIAPDLSINYDNRTSNFPNRMPPSFGIVSRNGPIDADKSSSGGRSVEELVTPRLQVQLGSNSKIVEISSTDLSDGRIIFPE